MNRRHTRNAGFSLTEVLMAAGILAMGFMMVLTLFPLGLKLTAKQTEATIGTLASREALVNASLLLQSDAAKALGVGANSYRDFDELFGVDDYDSRLFVYPSTWDVPDEDKKYNTTLLVGHSNGDYAEAIVFACRRVGAEARFPIEITDNLANIGERPKVLTISTATVAGEYDGIAANWLKINDTHKADLIAVGLSAYFASQSDIFIHKRREFLKVAAVVSPHTDGNYYLVLESSWSQPTRSNFGNVSFVPPAIGAGKSAAVSVSRQSIRIK